jgi:rRNA maturation endonuclease Nob1
MSNTKKSKLTTKEIQIAEAMLDNLFDNDWDIESKPMLSCKKCKERLDCGNVYCPKCGTKIANRYAVNEMEDIMSAFKIGQKI